VVPTLLAYVLSFVFLAIYWNNHHHLMHVVEHIDGGVLWANMHLLFWLSLTPFATAWMGEHPKAAAPVAVYGVVLLGAAIAYFVLTRALLRLHEPSSRLAVALGRDWKGKLSAVAYAVAVPLTMVSTWVALAASLAPPTIVKPQASRAPPAPAAGRRSRRALHSLDVARERHQTTPVPVGARERIWASPSDRSCIGERFRSSVRRACSIGSSGRASTRRSPRRAAPDGKPAEDLRSNKLRDVSLASQPGGSQLPTILATISVRSVGSHSRTLSACTRASRAVTAAGLGATMCC